MEIFDCPINEHLSIFDSFVRSWVIHIMLLCFLEIIVFRILNIFVWKHFNTTNEELMFHFLNAFNTFLTFVAQISRWMLGK